MEIKELKPQPSINQNKSLQAAYLQFNKLIHVLKTQQISNETIDDINTKIDQINTHSESEKQLPKQIRHIQASILKHLEKQYKLVPKNHYRNTWMAIGMSVFGIPMGVVFGTTFKNMAFLAIGLPIGMAVGIAVGAGMDKKAWEEGRQLDLEIKH